MIVYIRGLRDSFQLSTLNSLLGALSCRFFIRGEPPNKNAAQSGGAMHVREVSSRKECIKTNLRNAHPQLSTPQ
jgi:hypothetical protein